MYRALKRALKVAQNEVNESLLKLADEVIQNAQGSLPQEKTNLSELTTLVSTLQARQDTQFQTLTDAIQNLNKTLTQLVDNIGNSNAISMSSVIPSIQPTSVPIQMVSISQPVYKSIDLTIPSEEEEMEEVEEEMEEVEEVRFEGCRFVNNSAANGGGVANNGGRVIFDRCCCGCGT